MSRSDAQAVIRLPDDLKVFLKVQAAQNRRSQNSEIVHRLEESRAKEAAKPGAVPGKAVA